MSSAAHLSASALRFHELPASAPLNHGPSEVANSSYHARTGLISENDQTHHMRSAQDLPPSYEDLFDTPSQQPTSSRNSSPQISSSQPQQAKLQKPVAIPARSSQSGSPFLRAYPPSLGNFGLSKELFLKFLDDLNRNAVAYPPLQASDVAGYARSSAQIAGADASKGRTEVFLREANQQIFGPRGLRAVFAKIDGLAKVAGLPILDADGRLSKKKTLLRPAADCETSERPTAQQRRLATVEPYVAQLDIDSSPDIASPDDPLSKVISATSERRRRIGEERLLKHRVKRVGRIRGETTKAENVFEKLEGRLKELEIRESKVKDDGRSGRGVAKEMRDVERKKLKAQHKLDQKLKEVSKTVKTSDKREEKSLKKIVWLVITELKEEPVELAGDVVFRLELDGFSTMIHANLASPPLHSSSSTTSSSSGSVYELDSTSAVSELHADTAFLSELEGSSIMHQR